MRVIRITKSKLRHSRGSVLISPEPSISGLYVLYRRKKEGRKNTYSRVFIQLEGNPNDDLARGIDTYINRAVAEYEKQRGVKKRKWEDSVGAGGPGSSSSAAVLFNDAPLLSLPYRERTGLGLAELFPTQNYFRIISHPEVKSILVMKGRDKGGKDDWKKVTIERIDNEHGLVFFFSDNLVRDWQIELLENEQQGGINIEKAQRKHQTWTTNPHRNKKGGNLFRCMENKLHLQSTQRSTYYIFSIPLDFSNVSQLLSYLGLTTDKTALKNIKYIGWRLHSVKRKAGAACNVGPCPWKRTSEGIPSIHAVCVKMDEKNISWKNYVEPKELTTLQVRLPRRSIWTFCFGANSYDGTNLTYTESDSKGKGNEKSIVLSTKDVAFTVPFSRGPKEYKFSLMLKFNVDGFVGEFDTFKIVKVSGVDFDDYAPEKDFDFPQKKIEEYDQKIASLTDRMYDIETAHAVRQSHSTAMEKHFKSKLKNYKTFYGREWLYKILLENVEPTHGLDNEWFVLIQAPPGFGKSAIIVQLLGWHQESDKVLKWTSKARDSIKDGIIAHHFCDGGSEETLQGKPFLRGILRSLEGHDSLGFGKVNDSREDSVSDLCDLLVDALEKRQTPSRQLFIVVDGLDECLDRNMNCMTVIDVLEKLRGTLPKGLTIIATARRDERVNDSLSRLNANIHIDKDLDGWERNKKDVRGFIRAHMSEPLRGLKGIPNLLKFWLNLTNYKDIRTTIYSFLPPSDRKSLIKKPISKAFLYTQDIGFRILTSKAGGNFQYAKCALEAPQNRNEVPLCLLDLAPGLEGLYKLRYDNIFGGSIGDRGNDFDTFVSPLIELLLAANGPIPESILKDAHESLVQETVSKAERKHRKRAGPKYLKMVKQLCICDNGHVSFAHKSFVDWFGKEGHKYSVEEKEGHRKLAELGQEQWAEESPKGKYLLRNGVHHAVHANEVDRGRAMMFHFDRLLARARLGPPHALVEDANLTVAAGNSSNKAFNLLRSAIKLSQPALQRDPSQLGVQVSGRLLSHLHHPEIKQLVETIRSREGWYPMWPTMEQAGGACLATLAGHSGSVNSVAIEGERIVSGSDDNTINVWNFEGECLKTLEGHSRWVRSVAIEGERIVSGSDDNTIKVWNFEGECLKTLEGHSGGVTSVAIEGERIVSGSYDRTIKIWNFKGECLKTLEGHSEPVTSVAIEGERIVSGSYDNTIKIWNFKCECLKTLEGHSGWVTSVAIEGERIVSGSWDKTIQFWKYI